MVNKLANVHKFRMKQVLGTLSLYSCRGVLTFETLVPRTRIIILLRMCLGISQTCIVWVQQTPYRGTIYAQLALSGRSMVFSARGPVDVILKIPHSPACRGSRSMRH